MKEMTIEISIVISKHFSSNASQSSTIYKTYVCKMLNGISKYIEYRIKYFAKINSNKLLELSIRKSIIFFILFCSSSILPQHLLSTNDLIKLDGIYRNNGESQVVEYLQKDSLIISKDTLIEFIKINSNPLFKFSPKLLMIMEKRLNNDNDKLSLFKKLRAYTDIDQYNWFDLSYNDSLSVAAFNDSLHADILYCMGEFNYRRRHFDMAQRYYDSSMVYYNHFKDYYHQSRILAAKGSAFLVEKKDSLAINFFNQALSLSEKAESKGFAFQIKMYLSIAYLYYGEFSSYQKKVSESVEYLINKKEFSSIGSFYYNIANAYNNLQNADSAIYYFKKSLEYLNKSVIYDYNLGAMVNEQLGEFYKSRYLFDTAAKFYKVSYSQFKIAENFQLASESILNSAECYYETGNLDSVLINICRIDSLQNDKKSRTWEQNFYLLSKVNLLRSKIWLEAGDKHKAMGYAISSYFNADSVYDPIMYGKIILEMGIVGRTFFHFKDIDQIEMYYSWAERVFINNSRFDLIDIYIERGLYSIDQGKYDDAIVRLKNVIEKIDGKDYRRLFLINEGIASAYMQKKDFSNAIKYFSGLLKLEPYYHRDYGQVYIKLAQINSEIRNNNIAYQYFNKGIHQLEDERRQMFSPLLILSYQEKVYEAYNQGVRFMISNNYLENAFVINENLKGRALLDQINSHNFNQLNSELNARKDSLIKQKSSSLVKKSVINGKALKDSLDVDILKADEALDHLYEKLSVTNTKSALVGYAEPVKIKQLQSNLTSSEVFIDFYTSDDSIYVFLVAKDFFDVFKLKNNVDDIERDVDDFTNSVLLSAKYPAFTSTLYSKIIEPLNKYILGKKTLIISPDGILSQIPFEALFKKEGDNIRYLIEDYNIKYIQSGTILSYLRNEPERIDNKDNLVAFGDPVYDYEDFISGRTEKGETEKKNNLVQSFNRDGYERSGGKLNRLEGSGEEVKEISSLFGNNAKLFLRLDATEENLKSSMVNHSEYILLSCHGLLADDFQSLVLSQIPHSKEDGYITADEIMNLKWNATLVVLSACETGRGKISKGEGIMGLTRAVMMAGSRAIVASLWSVSDEGTKNLMINLFSNIIKNNMSIGDALRQAKISMINSNTEFSNPFYWSAFVLYGE